MSTTTDRLADRWLSGRPVYLTDLDGCRPADALSPSSRLCHWRTLPYATGERSGVMLYASEQTGAPPVTYQLGRRGWHAISFGVMPADHEYERWSMDLLARLSGDPAFTSLSVPDRPAMPGQGDWLVELFWKIADLSDQNLQIGQVVVPTKPGDEGGPFACPPARPAYVKLVPLTDAEVAELKADRARADTRRIYAHSDAHGWMGHSRPHTAEHVRRMLEPFRDSDFARVYWEAGGGDLLNYFSGVGRQLTLDGLDDLGLLTYRNQIESWRMFRDAGVDPFDVAIEHAHELGIEFHAGWRPTGFHYPPPFDYFNHGDTAYKAHPEWRGEDRAGNRTPRLSYAYPEFRAYAVSLLREMAERPIDGVALLYNRRPPFVEYEPPLVEGFKQEHGQDPRALPEDDPGWLAFRAGTMTQFMREVRSAMDEATERRERSKRIQVSAIVFASEEENMRWGMDVRAWVREGLVDTIVAYPYGPRGYSQALAWRDPVSQLSYHREVVAGSQCTLAVNLYPRSMAPDAYRRQAAAIYATGIDRLFIWDCTNSAGNESFTALRRLGHADELQAWMAAGEPGLESSQTRLRQLGDWDFAYTTPG